MEPAELSSRADITGFPCFVQFAYEKKKRVAGARVACRTNSNRTPYNMLYNNNMYTDEADVLSVATGEIV